MNNSVNYESIYVQLDPIKTPIAYNNKVEELVEQGLDKETAEKVALEPIEMDLIYEKEYGLFCIESGAVESGTIYSPYNGSFNEK